MESSSGNIGPEQPPPKHAPLTSLERWQYRVLPWMIGLPTALIFVFILLATGQLNRFNEEVNNYKASEIDKSLPQPNDSTGGFLLSTNLEYVKFYTLAKMEEEAMNRRYSQAGVLLVARVYTSYLGFFTGMILAIVGSVFIISKLKESESKLELSLKEQVKLQVISSSPGIIFGVLGTVLMIATILEHNNIEVKDMPLFLNYPSMQQLRPTAPGNAQGKTKADSVSEKDHNPLSNQ